MQRGIFRVEEVSMAVKSASIGIIRTFRHCSKPCLSSSHWQTGGKPRAPSRYPVQIIPMAWPLFLSNHSGKIDTWTKFSRIPPIPKSTPCVRTICQSGISRKVLQKGGFGRLEMPAETLACRY